MRYSLALLLRVFTDLELVGEAWDGQEAVMLCGVHHPHVVLMDLDMPRMDGVLATRLICTMHPGVRVLILTAAAEQTGLQKALEAGAVGVIRKDASIDEISQAVRDAAAD